LNINTLLEGLNITNDCSLISDCYTERNCGLLEYTTFAQYDGGETTCTDPGSQMPTKTANSRAGIGDRLNPN